VVDLNLEQYKKIFLGLPLPDIGYHEWHIGKNIMINFFRANAKEYQPGKNYSVLWFNVSWRI
jgi:hypothetical protein